MPESMTLPRSVTKRPFAECDKAALLTLWKPQFEAKTAC